MTDLTNPTYPKTTANKTIVTKFFVDGYVNLNFDNLLNLLDVKYIDHSPCHATSAQECINALKTTAQSLSNMQIKIADLIEENNKVTVRVLFSCKHTGSFLGIPATNRDIEFEALEIFRLKDGKIVESWGYWPDSLIKQQLLS